MQSPSDVSEPEESTEVIWIIGGGQFGLRAVHQLTGDTSSPLIILVDRTPLEIRGENIEIVTGDATSWLQENLSLSARVSKIIPAVPLHLAACWLQAKLPGGKSAWHRETIPERILDQFPHPFLTADGSATLSYADFLCPPDCVEPEGYCTYTGQFRPIPLHRYVETIDCTPCRLLILRSRQFGPGVGGFYPEDVWALLSHARENPEQPLLIVTACNCHGVATLLCPNGHNLTDFPPNADTG